MPSYETTVITKPNTTEDQINAIRTKVEGIIQQHNGTVGIYEDWGTRRLSYEIQKENRGRYVYFAFTGNNGTVAELERNFRINENIVRFLSVNLAKEDDLELVKRPSAMKRVRKPSEDSLEGLEG
jgi:small subunit ribosomal protein S6